MPTYMGTIPDSVHGSVYPTALGIFALGLSVFWLHLQLLFPRPLKFLTKHKRWIIPVIYIPWVTLIVVALLGAMTSFDTNLAEKISQWVLAPMLLSLIVGFVILSRRFARTEDRLEKRQLRLVFWGTAIGLGGFLVLLIAFNVFGEYFDGNTMLSLGSIVACFSLLLLTPISFAYAFGKLQTARSARQTKTRHTLLDYGGTWILCAVRRDVCHRQLHSVR